MKRLRAAEEACHCSRIFKPPLFHHIRGATHKWGYLYSALEVDGENAAEFLCLPRVDLGISRLLLEQIAARDPDAEPVVIQDQAGLLAV